jgi:hypothetical protein
MNVANISYGVLAGAILFGLAWAAGLAVPLFPVAIILAGAIALQDAGDDEQREPQGDGQ